MLIFLIYVYLLGTPYILSEYCANNNISIWVLFLLVAWMDIASALGYFGGKSGKVKL
jgi:hypothetical protein